MATAQRLIQRRIIPLGLAAGQPSDGLALARALGMTTYRTEEEFAERFEGMTEVEEAGIRFPVEGYLDHGSRRFAQRWTPERYLALSESLDLHRVDPATIHTPTGLFAVREDRIVPTWQVRELADRLAGPVNLTEISSRYGHDAFLKAVGSVGDFVAQALELGRRHAA